MADVPELKTRKPTGKPPWPMILLAGGEKTGKSWAAAAFSASAMIGRTFYVELGEHYADEYGSIPGARYEIVEHDGSYRSIGGQIYAATRAPREDGKPNCIVFDSATILWDMLSKQAQATANARWRKKNPNAPEPDDEIQITMDLWNIAKEKFGRIINLLRQHDGPVILTARLEQVAVVVNGKPTTEKAWKVQAEKNLPYEVDAVIQLREPRAFVATGLRSTRFQLEPGKPMPMPGFTVEGFLCKLGLDQDGATSPRTVVLPQSSVEARPRPEPDRPMERSRPTQPPEDDPWATEGPQVLTVEQAAAKMRANHPDDVPPIIPAPASDETPAAPRPSTNGQRTKLVILIKEKRGLTDRHEQHAVASQIIDREIESFKDLTFTEAHRLIDAFTREPDYTGPTNDQPQPIRPNPRSGEGPMVDLRPTDGPAALAADLVANIEGAATLAELEAAGQAVAKAQEADRLMPFDLERLESAWVKRDSEIRTSMETAPDGSWSHRRLEQMTGAQS